MAPRFLSLTDVAEVLAITPTQARALVLSKELPAIQIGGRRIWRVEADQLESYIQRQYALTRDQLDHRSADHRAVDEERMDAP